MHSDSSKTPKFEHKAFAVGFTVSKELFVDDPILRRFLRSLAAIKGWRTRRLKCGILKRNFLKQ